MSPQASHDSRKRFRRLISQQAKSGLTVAAFCKQHSISESQYYYWRVRIKGKRKQPVPKQQASFLPIPMSPMRNSEGEIKIVLHDSATIHLPAKNCQEALPIILNFLTSNSACSFN